jgi:hypothetical protein
VADEWIVAVAKLRLEPVVLIKAIASQTPAIAGRRGCLGPQTGAGTAPRSEPTPRADDRRVVVRDNRGLGRPASSGRDAADGVPSADSRFWALPAEAVAQRTSRSSGIAAGWP